MVSNGFGLAWYEWHHGTVSVYGIDMFVYSLSKFRVILQYFEGVTQ